ncbi:hypothetical protein AB1Y20_014276 [Prymnesium parvum]|uniref:Uncharacterized protein n=1 Tax=Prymnesium parvum TaxID=97485 RepID=A0AB34IEI2_PRYPA
MPSAQRLSLVEADEGEWEHNPPSPPPDPRTRRAFLLLVLLGASVLALSLPTSPASPTAPTSPASPASPRLQHPRDGATKRHPTHLRAPAPAVAPRAPPRARTLPPSPSASPPPRKPPPPVSPAPRAAPPLFPSPPPPASPPPHAAPSHVPPPRREASCLHTMSASGLRRSNRVTEKAQGVGVWGGECTCPDGQAYLVGDQLDYCHTLACEGGRGGACQMEERAAWSGRRVECGAAEPSARLWVLSDGALIGKTAAARPSRAPHWKETICSHEVPQKLCFEVRDDAQATLLGGACASAALSAAWAAAKESKHSLELDDGSKLEVHVSRAQPPSPPASPTPPLPPVPRLPARRTKAAIVALLNERFRKGAPSNDLESAGVLVRQFDTLDDAKKPWLPCPATDWCAAFADRWATSIIHPGARRMYYGSEKGGFVLAPTVSIFCAYPEDGNSMDGNKVCHPLGGDGVHCIPGCYPLGQTCAEVGHEWSCSFPPTQLREALQAQLRREDMKQRNNEIVVDLASVEAQLPRSIEGFFVGAEEAHVREVREQFMLDFGLSDADGPPLLRLNLDGGGEAPFTLIP